MPFLMTIVIQCLGSSNADLRETAGRTLGELVERLADKVIPTVLPALTSNKDTSVASRQGACLGLRHLVSASQKAQLVLYQDSLTEAVIKSLLDEHENVRDAAAEAFSEVFEKCGKKVMDQVLEALLEAAATNVNAEDSLQRIATIDADKIVAVLVPKLVAQQPLPVWAMRCLAGVAKATGFYFSKQLSLVLPVLAAESKHPAESSKTALEIALSTPEDGMHILVDKVVDLTRESDPNVIVFACSLMGQFTNQHEHGAMDDNLARFMEITMSLYLDERDAVLDAACASMKLLMDSVVSASEARFVKSVRTGVQALRFSQIKAGKEVGNVPGLNRPQGLGPVVGLLRQGVMNGSAEIKELSATTISEVLRLCTATCIQSATVMQLAPIIRVLGEKVDAGVKKAILGTLNVLLELVPALLKALTPQFQTVFTRALQDTDQGVRDEAAKALGRLMGLNPRVDPLVNELCTSIVGSPAKVRQSMLTALVGVLEHAGDKLSDKGQERVTSCLDALRDDVSFNADDRTRELAAEGFGALSAVLSGEALRALAERTLAGCRSKEENSRDVCVQTLGRVAATLNKNRETQKEKREVLLSFADGVLTLLAAPADRFFSFFLSFFFCFFFFFFVSFVVWYCGAARTPHCLSGLCCVLPIPKQRKMSRKLFVQ
jgi:HEAT repeat protein